MTQLQPNQSLKRDVATADALRVLNVVVSKDNLCYDRIFKLKKTISTRWNVATQLSSSPLASI